MVQIRATEAKNQFGHLLTLVQRETVLIEKNGRSVAVVLSQENYDRLKASEEALWALKADMARKEGFHTPEESEKILEKLLDAQN